MPSRSESIDLFRLVVEQAPDAIIFADCEGAVQVWNHAAADLFGFRPDQAIGQRLDIIIPEHLRHAHWDGYRKAVTSGHTEHGSHALKTRATDQNGHKLYVSLAFSVVKDQADKVIGAMATARALHPDKAA